MSLFEASVPAYLQILGSLTKIMAKAEAHAIARKFEPAVLLESRLFPDMLPLRRQIQLSCDHAAKGTARISGAEVPVVADTETTFAELNQRLGNTIAYLGTFTPAQFAGAEDRDITFPIGADKTMTMKAQQFLSHFNLPNFYFHAVTAHDILRHNGVEIGKRDFMGVT